MSDLPLQPKLESTLTLAYGPMRDSRGDICVCAVCICGRFVRMRRSTWLDGARRPGSCSVCAKPRRRAGFKVDVMHRAPITPFYERASRR